MMGVSGCGKTTIGKQLAERLNLQGGKGGGGIGIGIFLDGDDYHPLCNKQKMKAGIPLQDEDRYPWFDVLKQEIMVQCGLLQQQLSQSQSQQQSQQQHHPQAVIVVACSALKAAYRNRLRNFDNYDYKHQQQQEQQQLHININIQPVFVYLKGSKEFIAKRLQRRVDHEFMPSTLLDSQFETLEEPPTSTQETETAQSSSPSSVVDSNGGGGGRGEGGGGGDILVVPIENDDDGQPKSVDQIVTEIIEKL